MSADYNALLGQFHQPSATSHSCGCVGPQNGNPVCPCRMPAYLEQEAGRKALAILRQMPAKPRVRVKAKSLVVMA